MDSHPLVQIGRAAEEKFTSGEWRR
jgi:hypothetical protein